MPTGNMATNATKGAIKSMPPEVELDIFSGMPNPTWTLSSAEAESFLNQLAALPRTSATRLRGNLGYRGFIVHVTNGSDTQLIHIQTGVVQISKGATIIYARDEHREVERWLLNTGKPHLKNDILQIVERELK
jgi:hypothetical protein